MNAEEGEIRPDEGVAGESSFIAPVLRPELGSQEGDRCDSGDEHKNEPENTAPLGDRESSAHVGDTDDCLVRVTDIVDRFTQQTKPRLKEQTAREYAAAFEVFAERAHLGDLTKRQIAGTRGKQLVLEHLQHIPKTCWRWQNAALKAVWMYGLNLPWPIDPKRDFGRLPKTQPRETPPNRIVQAWADGLEHEPDPYLRLIWLFVAQHGWRPSHVGRLKWRNVRYDQSGRPTAIIADGGKEDFKTSSPIAARLCPDVADALLAWKEVASEPLPERPIIPWRWGNGKVNPSKAQGRTSLRRHWDRLQETWNLPSLRMCDLRHWVSTTCRRAGLSKPASAYLTGHDARQGGSMRDWYDNPGLEDIFAEQVEKLPDGPLGTLTPVRLEPTEGLAPESVDLLREYMDGKIGTMEFANRIESIRLRLSAVQPPSMQP